MDCLHCGGELKKGTAPFSVDRDGYHVHWNALPAWVCAQCGEPLFEKEEVDRVQRALGAIDAQMPRRSKVA
jgi:YgiT-type zinc finger domain-containing protein